MTILKKALKVVRNITERDFKSGLNVPPMFKRSLKYLSLDVPSIFQTLIRFFKTFRKVSQQQQQEAQQQQQLLNL